MKTSAIAFALLACCLLPASGQGEAPGSASAFGLSGDLTAAVGLSVREALHGPIEFEEATAPSALRAVLSFARGYRALGLLDFTFGSSNLLYESGGVSALRDTLSFDVNQVYADLNFGDLLYLRAGKQRLKWGAGWVFNPSDPVNPPKDPTRALQTNEGVPALKAELITSVLSLAAFGTVFERPQEFGIGGKISSSALEGSDFSLSAYWSPTESWTTALNLSVAPLYALPGWDTIQLWFEGGLYGEPRYRALGPVPGPTGLQHALLAGVSATLPVVRTALLAEYYHLSEGLSAGQESTLFAALRGGSADLEALGLRPARVGRDYVFLSVTQGTITDNGHPVFDHIGLSSTVLVNLTDFSVFVRHGITTTFVQDSALELSVAWTAGGRDGEFANLVPAVSGELALKIYF
jgi:hypothetical protein